MAETDSPGYKLRFGMPLACIHAIFTLLPIVYFRQQLPKPLFSELTFFNSVHVPIVHAHNVHVHNLHVHNVPVHNVHVHVHNVHVHS